MINDDVLIKATRARGHKKDWPEVVVGMKERLREMKSGFPGIRDEHMTLMTFDQLAVGDIFIYDEHLEDYAGRSGDEAPIMYRILESGEVQIEGIGYGVDSKRDPDRLLYRWMDKIPMPKIDSSSLVCCIDVRPTLNSGSAYYYFYKSYRDYRV